MAKQLEDYMQWPEIEALMYAECGRPETVLGPKQVDKSHVLITAFEPEADSIVVSGEDLKKEYKMTKMDETGYFAVLIQAKKIPSYHFVLKQGKKKIEKTDAYAVDSLFDGVAMTPFTKQRVRADVLQIIIHPAHVPFQIKIKTALFDRTGHLRPRCRFLSNRKASVFSFMNFFVQIL